MDIITMARDLGKAIQQDERYVLFHQAKNIADSDTELQDMIGKFNLKKMELQTEIQKDRNSDRMKEIDGELKALYATIMDDENMKAYNEAKKELDDVLNYVNQIIVYSANGDDPDSIQMQSAGCSGSCSGCSGCN